MGSIPTRKQPNFLVIVADDLGYSDLGCFGSEIATPNLDRLSQTGVRLTNFHTASACSPTRSMLFSGTDNHIAGLGQMTEHMARFMDKYKNRPGYEGYLNFRVAALSEILQDAGYHTIMSGKWHLGTTNETSPHARGFDNSYVFLSGCCNHYNYEPQLDDPAHGFFTPMNAGKFWMQDDRFLDRKNPEDIPDDFYSTTTFSEKLIDYLKDRKDTEQPFFAYLPFTAPHWPLQAPRETIEKYKGVYDDGPAALRKRRLANLVELGLISEDTEPAPMTVELWDKMSPTEKAESARKMEVYAAMVDLIDVNIGRVVDYLDSVDELDNTFVLFMSDNGAEGAMLEAVPMMGSVGSVPRIINKYYNNSIDNMGMADSYIWYGPEWACASMAPSRGFKTWITEGGIRCPCLVRYPPFSKAGGSHTDSFCTVMDILPTILDLAGVRLPGSKFRGREVFPVRGSSWVSHLEDQAPAFHDEEKEITGWELFGLRAIREGRWKALYMTAPRGKDKWELYNLKNDPGELHDLADNNPDIMDRLINLWEIYYSETGMFDPGHEFGVTKI
ncbi:arylsulfatase [Fusarium oxysporum f. sp. lycopersici 4287]|uniref:Arylsulfatase n=3 Tax=Fusarium oxysporum TaxID=5507 RepID=A0A0J9U8V6_FUSO4|nr:arylsulfatase [Fusarium oxysporum f. sp. lycopersici 4287]EXK49117.1 arylsulfatase [Fusarium oxysporum f. sp. melonis 26406]KAJ9428317.1 arylsulfatase [Fusarium oxysporum]KNA95409.1 arylsulfatase [Fusarium oxysporum f. sp. lycopersici 4287]